MISIIGSLSAGTLSFTSNLREWGETEGHIEETEQMYVHTMEITDVHLAPRFCG
jgi:hypothetical protein